MNIKNLFLLGIVPLLLMAFGLLNRSMFGLPGNMLVLTGAGGWLVSILLRFSIRRAKWFDAWWTNVLTGLAGCALVLVIILIYFSISR